MRLVLMAGFVLAFAGSARAADYYVAVDGDDSHAGTTAEPFATVERAQTAAAAGDTVYLRGGVYKFSGTTREVGVSFTKSGQEGQPILYAAAPGEQPIFDLFELKPQARVTGLDVRCNWIHLRGLDVRGVRQIIVGDSWSVRIRGDHNVVEQLNVHDGQAPGIFIASGAANLILNCDSHHNYDPLEDAGNADGFGCHSAGGANVLRGCRAYENSDDGFDFINAAGTCTVEDSWSFRNGYIPDTDMTGANGAGFKSGGYGEPPNIPSTGAARHVVRRNVAFGNRASGFYANHHPGGIDFFDNTAFDNPANYDMRTTSSVVSSHKLRNNLAVMPGRDVVNWTGGGTDEANSWTLQVQVSKEDFVSMDKAQALLPRQADGSLPALTFMHLVQGSDLIDRGQDVGLPFVGAAPDLGAYEFGAMEMGGAGAGAAGVVGSGVPSVGGSGGPGVGGSGGPSGGSSGAVGTGVQPRGGSGTAAVGGSGPGTGTDAGSGASAPGTSRAGAGAAVGGTGGSSLAAAGSGGHGVGSDTLGSEQAPVGASGCGCRVAASCGGDTRRSPLLALMMGLIIQRRSRRRAWRVAALRAEARCGH
jgi:hypothetical protein